jgi:hypothetical protein
MPTAQSNGDTCRVGALSVVSFYLAQGEVTQGRHSISFSFSLVKTPSNTGKNIAGPALYLYYILPGFQLRPTQARVLPSQQSIPLLSFTLVLTPSNTDVNIAGPALYLNYFLPAF